MSNKFMPPLFDSKTKQILAVDSDAVKHAQQQGEGLALYVNKWTGRCRVVGAVDRTLGHEITLIIVSATQRRQAEHSCRAKNTTPIPSA
ncbi:hypothetical protein [Xanthomonas phage JGB6]|nr:hypothetical protein [Xanthomonas phage JGB6]